MALHNGIDTVAVITEGEYSETYTSVSDAENIANLFCSEGLLEDAPGAAETFIIRRTLILGGW